MGPNTCYIESNNGPVNFSTVTETSNASNVYTVEHPIVSNSFHHIDDNNQLLHLPTIHESRLNPLAPPFKNTNKRSSLQDTNKPPTTKRNKSKKTPAADTEGINLEFTKYAANTAKAKICEQEVEINDLKVRNNILEQRLAIIEKKYKDDIGGEILNHHCKQSNQCVGHSCCCHSPQPRSKKCHQGEHTVDESYAINLSDLFQQMKSMFNILTAKFDQLLSVIGHSVTVSPVNTGRQDINRSNDTQDTHYATDESLDSSFVSMDFEEHLNCE